MCDLFLLMSESNVANHVDDTTLYACEKKVTWCAKKLSIWIFNTISVVPEVPNYLKANSSKSHVMLTTDKLKINVKSSLISNRKIVQLLGVAVDNRLSFKPHLNLLCKKVSQKLHVLARVWKFISQKKLRVIMKAVIMSQFSYSPLVWMCHNRTLNNKINKLHEKGIVTCLWW